jgi:hypothetical protein
MALRNKELKKELEEIYDYGMEAHVDDAKEAAEAQESGDMPGYFDLSLNLELADTCWALEKWEEAKHWYRHNARIMLMQYEWHKKYSGLDYPHDGSSDWMAGMLIKAGDLSEGRKHLERAIEFWKAQKGSDLVLSALGLHAAQIGVEELSGYANSITDAREELIEADEPTIRKAGSLINYEPAQVNLLLGKWDEFLSNTEQLNDNIELIKGFDQLVFPEPMQKALIAASQGLISLASLYKREIDPDPGSENAKNSFEEAMVNFYNFSGRIDSNVYFMRLNTRFADELAKNSPLIPNPFASDFKA